MKAPPLYTDKQMSIYKCNKYPKRYFVEFVYNKITALAGESATGKTYFAKHPPPPLKPTRIKKHYPRNKKINKNLKSNKIKKKKKKKKNKKKNK